MATKEEIDRRLALFLDNEENEARNGFTKRAIHDTMKSMDGRMAAHELEDKDRHREAMDAVLGLNARMNLAEVELKRHDSFMKGLDRTVDETGRHMMTSLSDIAKHEMLEAKADRDKVVERVWKIALAMIIGIMTIGLAYVAGRLGVSAPPGHSEHTIIVEGTLS